MLFASRAAFMQVANKGKPCPPYAASNDLGLLWLCNLRIPAFCLHRAGPDVASAPWIRETTRCVRAIASATRVPGLGHACAWLPQTANTKATIGRLVASSATVVELQSANVSLRAFPGRNWGWRS